MATPMATPNAKPPILLSTLKPIDVSTLSPTGPEAFGTGVREAIQSRTDDPPDTRYGDPRHQQTTNVLGAVGEGLKSLGHAIIDPTDSMGAQQDGYSGDDAFLNMARLVSQGLQKSQEQAAQPGILPKVQSTLTATGIGAPFGSLLSPTIASTQNRPQKPQENEEAISSGTALAAPLVAAGATPRVAKWNSQSFNTPVLGNLRARAGLHFAEEALGGLYKHAADDLPELKSMERLHLDDKIATPYQRGSSIMGTISELSNRRNVTGSKIRPLAEQLDAQRPVDVSRLTTASLSDLYQRHIDTLTNAGIEPKAVAARINSIKGIYKAQMQKIQQAGGTVGRTQLVDMYRELAEAMSKNDITQERVPGTPQAFMKDLRNKYSQIASTVDVDPYNKLGAAMRRYSLLTKMEHGAWAYGFANESLPLESSPFSTFSIQQAAKSAAKHTFLGPRARATMARGATVLAGIGDSTIDPVSPLRSSGLPVRQYDPELGIRMRNHADYPTPPVEDGTPRTSNTGGSGVADTVGKAGGEPTLPGVRGGGGVPPSPDDADGVPVAATATETLPATRPKRKFAEPTDYRDIPVPGDSLPSARMQQPGVADAQSKLVRAIANAAKAGQHDVAAQLTQEYARRFGEQPPSSYATGPTIHPEADASALFSPSSIEQAGRAQAGRPLTPSPVRPTGDLEADLAITQAADTIPDASNPRYANPTPAETVSPDAAKRAGQQVANGSDTVRLNPEAVRRPGTDYRPFQQRGRVAAGAKKSAAKIASSVKTTLPAESKNAEVRKSSLAAEPRATTTPDVPANAFDKAAAAQAASVAEFEKKTGQRVFKANAALPKKPVTESVPKTAPKRPTAPLGSMSETQLDSEHMISAQEMGDKLKSASEGGKNPIRPRAMTPEEKAARSLSTAGQPTDAKFKSGDKMTIGGRTVTVKEVGRGYSHVVDDAIGRGTRLSNESLNKYHAASTPPPVTTSTSAPSPVTESLGGKLKEAVKKVKKGRKSQTPVTHKPAPEPPSTVQTPTGTSTIVHSTEDGKHFVRNQDGSKSVMTDDDLAEFSRQASVKEPTVPPTRPSTSAPSQSARQYKVDDLVTFTSGRGTVVTGPIVEISPFGNELIVKGEDGRLWPIKDESKLTKVDSKVSPKSDSPKSGPKKGKK